MRKLQYSLLCLVCLVNFSVFGQHEMSKKLLKKTQKVYNYAQEGYQKLDGKKLAKAAQILIKNPIIQQLSESEKVNEKSILEDEKSLEHHDFFDPKILLKDAKVFAAVDDKRLRRKIRKLEAKLMNYDLMSVNAKKLSGGIRVKNYLIYSKNSKTIETNLGKKQRIILSVRVGNDLRLSVYNKKTKKKVGKSHFIGDARMITFVTDNVGIYEIRIQNVAGKANDCLLMIEITK